MYSLGLSIFYLVTYIAAFWSLLVVKKSEKRLNVVLCLPIYVLVMMLYIAFFAGVIDILGVPINLVSLGIGNVLLSAGICIYIFKKKEFQKYRFEWLDLAALLILVILTVIIAASQFGFDLNINYETTDPSRHMRYAQTVIETQELGKMYFGAFTNAVFMSVGLGFVESFFAYKLFILMDILMFLLSGCIMYCAARLYAKNVLQKVMSLIAIIFYLWCYPLNNMVFGFVYLGMGVSICAFLLIMLHCYREEIINKIFAILALMLGAYGIIICYSLFSPFVYIAIALCIAIEFIKEKRLFSGEFFATEFGIFLIPTAMGLYFSFFKMFGGSISDVGNSIGLEGYIYRNLYSNFIIILPFVIYGLINAVVGKKIRCQHILLLILGITVFCMFLLGLKGEVSSYYYYKMYYILSMVCFVVAIEGICDLCKKSFNILISYGLVWVFLAFMNFSGIDDKITAKKVLMSPSSSASGAFFSIIEFNQDCIESKNFPEEKTELYEYAYNICGEDELITLLAPTETVFWFEPFIQRNLKDFYCYSFDDTNIKGFVDTISVCDYIVVHKEHDDRFDPYINEWKEIYTNDYGSVYALKN